jgi:DNA mismatch endonuclease (patch repair protein)
MRANRRSDTLPEIRLRSALHQAGARFRKDYPIDAEGMRVRADIAFPGRKIAIFLDGCFWHRCPLHGTDPKLNSDFWRRKLDRNVERDREVNASLAAADWTVLRFWEHVRATEAAELVIRQLARNRV